MTQHPTVFPFTILRMLNETTHTSEKRDLKSILGLNFRLFNTSSPGPHLSLCESSFHFWQNSWEKTFAELNCPQSLWSDDFLHKELGGLFINDQPIGFLLYQFLDLKRPTYQSLSYFKNYPKDLKQKVCADQDQVMAISYMTVNSDWRKTKTDYSISELLISFAVLRFLQSPAQRLIGYFRNNRGTQNIFYRHGGHPLLQSLMAYNVEVDFAQIIRSSAHLSELPFYDQLALYFWNQDNNHFINKGTSYDDQSRTNSVLHEATERHNPQFQLGKF
jgi:hypothetical protein